MADLELRELLADEARSACDVWNEEAMAIDPRAAVLRVVAILREAVAATSQRNRDLLRVPSLLPAEEQAGESPLQQALRKPSTTKQQSPVREVG